MFLFVLDNLLNTREAMTAILLNLDIEASEASNTITRKYNSDSVSSGEEEPFFAIPSVRPKERRHQFEAAEHASTSYFPEEGMFKELFLKENSALRLKLYTIW